MRYSAPYALFDYSSLITVADGIPCSNSLGELAGGLTYLSVPVDRCDRPLHHVIQYMERYGACLDRHCSGAMHLAGDAKEIPDVYTRRKRDTALMAWINQLLPSSGRTVTYLLCLYWGTGSPFGPRCKEVGYEQRIAHILGHLHATVFPKIPFGLEDLIRFSGPYQCIYLVPNW